MTVASVGEFDKGGKELGKCTWTEDRTHEQDVQCFNTVVCQVQIINVYRRRTRKSKTYTQTLGKKIIERGSNTWAALQDNDKLVILKCPVYYYQHF